MKDNINRKLDILDELFPKERIQASKARIRSLWEGRKPSDRYPYTHAYALFNMYNALHSPAERLEFSLDEFYIHGKMKDDLVPALFPGDRTSTIPNMFGAEEVILEGDVSGKRIIFSKEDILKLEEPSLKPGTIAHNWLLMQEYFLEETNGRIPVHVTDMQGPFDVAAMMMSYDDLFILAMTEPETYHLFLGKVTQAFINLWKAQKDLLGDLFVPTHLFGHSWVPPEFGASISADCLVMMGPDFYREFVQPYFEQIGDVYGDTAIHSCGNFAQNVACLGQTRHVRGINASQMTVKELLDAGMSREIILINLVEREDVEEMYRLVREKNLLVDMGVLGMPWPEDRDGEPVSPWTWTEDDWESLKRADDEILETLNMEMPQ